MTDNTESTRVIDEVNESAIATLITIAIQIGLCNYLTQALQCREGQYNSGEGEG